MFVFTVWTLPLKEKKKVLLILSLLLVVYLFPYQVTMLIVLKKNPDHNFLPTAKHDLLNYHGNF